MISRMVLFGFLIVFMAGWSYLLCSLDHECRPFSSGPIRESPLLQTTVSNSSNFTNENNVGNLTNSTQRIWYTSTIPDVSDFFAKQGDKDLQSVLKCPNQCFDLKQPSGQLMDPPKHLSWKAQVVPYQVWQSNKPPNNGGVLLFFARDVA